MKPFCKEYSVFIEIIIQCIPNGGLTRESEEERDIISN